MTDFSIKDDEVQVLEKEKITSQFPYNIENKIQIQPQNIPQELKDLRQWVCFEVKPDESGKLGKLPKNPHNGKNASSNNPETWGTFDQALAGCHKYKFTNIGFAFTKDDPYCGIDIDHCVEQNKELSTTALAVLNHFDGTYSEHSTSGTGIHLITKGNIPDPGRKNTKLGIEIYNNSRFFVCTGASLNAHPKPIIKQQEQINAFFEMYFKKEEPQRQSFTPVSLSMSDNEIIEKAKAAKNGNKFSKLYAGDISDYQSASEANFAFYGIVAFWTQDPVQIANIFQSSGLCKTENQIKKFKRLGEKEIAKAISKCSDVYKPSHKHAKKCNLDSLQTKDVSKKIDNFKFLNANFEDFIKGLIRNERGDAELFIKLTNGKYVFDCTEGKTGEFYVWTGSHWELDRKKQRIKDIEIVSQCFQDASEIANENENDKEKKAISDLLSKRAYALRSSKRCKSVFEFVSSEISFDKEWDYCPGKLPCLNGIVDLKTGELIPHKQEYFIRSICPTHYNPLAPRYLFDKFLNDITLDDRELKSFLKRLLGSALLGMPKEEKVYIFYGEDGRNGKGSLMQTLEVVLGPLAKTFPSEMLLLQRNPPSSSTPRPEKANLQGVRFAIFSEIAEKRQIDASEVKNLSGRDTITCRRLFSNQDIQIKPSHTMIIQTNFKPKASAKDGALWKRNVLVPFKAEFVEDPKKTHQRKIDEGFKEKLLLEKEGILAWIVEGCLEYQQSGLAIPKVVQDETVNYRKENDGIGRFLSEMCIEDPVFSTPKSKMEKSIKDFCSENKCDSPNRIEISAYLKEKYGEFHTEKGNFWRGVKIVDDREVQ